ncbi:hypothetical protein RD792_010808 [Penstemon davidsonii]|uniref:Aminoacyl-transfer RNA synthetases class-II family profile domain-containing protein n=1 Tax=Penstemon davidsonii TaxID=160366 RepID=A0ABR0D2T7_9LAMI|nr:hypothetical protein RD792_010808 [Penstemon davidsonii]
MAAAISPAAAATTLRLLRPFSSAAASPSLFSLLHRPKLTAPLNLFSSPAISRQHRSFCSVVSSAVSSGESTISEPLEVENVAKIREFRKKLKIVDIKGGPDEGLNRLGETIVVRGWVRTLRAQSSVTFIEVNDGSCISNMQCVMGVDAQGYDQSGLVGASGPSTSDMRTWFLIESKTVENNVISTGASVWIQGTLVGSQGSKQKVGKSDPSFPIQKKRVSREFLRTKAHLRPRTNTFGAKYLCPSLVQVSRVRNALAYATHKFFQENGFVWLSSPIITASDCEGAGEQFCVTTLVPNSTEALVKDIPTTKEGLIDWSQDFFGKPAFLTVSGQLNAETYATALTDMIEPELAFADLEDDMACATAYLQYVVQYVLENCKEDMDFFNTWIEKGIINRLSDVAQKNFVQLTYTEAVELLLKAKKKFEFPVTWGCDLQSEHERYITEEAFGGCPEIKAFYMRQNDDEKTVAAMDMLVPRVGELIGGSQREERLEYLEQRLDELKLNKESYWWYLDLRRYGSVPHAGFGLGFERLVQFATGIDNIRDAIPFPRAPGSAEF